MLYSRKSTVILDFQYHYGKNHEIVVKELATLKDDICNVRKYLFLPPYPITELSKKEKKQVHYVENKINGLNWTHGHIPYTYLADLLRAMDKNDKIETILVKGHEKFEFVHGFTDKVEEIPMAISFGEYASYAPFPPWCENHHAHLYRCSLKNVINMFMYLLKNDWIKK